MLSGAEAREMGRKIVAAHPEGISIADINAAIAKRHPEMVGDGGKVSGTIRGATWELDKRFPGEIVKLADRRLAPKAGLRDYQHNRLSAAVNAVRAPKPEKAHKPEQKARGKKSDPEIVADHTTGGNAMAHPTISIAETPGPAKVAVNRAAFATIIAGILMGEASAIKVASDMIASSATDLGEDE